MHFSVDQIFYEGTLSLMSFAHSDIRHSSWEAQKEWQTKSARLGTESASGICLGWGGGGGGQIH